MDKIKVLVVEDEVIIADNICDTLESFGYDALEPAMTYSEAIERIEAHQPDIAILDIHLNGVESGVELAKTINANYDFPFIFLTSNSDRETFNEAKVLEPNAFIAKPFGKEELYAAIELALFSYSKKPDAKLVEHSVLPNALFIRQKAHFVRVDFNNIVYIRSDSVYLDFYLREGKPLTIRGTLNDFISKLENNFIRCHRSYIINITNLDSISSGSAIVAGVEIPIGKKYRAFLLERLSLG